MGEETVVREEDIEMTENDKAKIPVKLRVSVRLAGPSFDGMGRAHFLDYDGDYPPPDDVEDVSHYYAVEDFSIEVPKELMEHLTPDCFLEIEVNGKLDHITDDATEEVKLVAWRRRD